MNCHESFGPRWAFRIFLVRRFKIVCEKRLQRLVLSLAGNDVVGRGKTSSIDMSYSWQHIVASFFSLHDGSGPMLVIGLPSHPVILR